MGGPVRNSFSTENDEVSKLEAHEKLQAKVCSVSIWFAIIVFQCKGLESDLRSMLGIKEELLMERDEMQRKVARLSNELSYLLNGDPRRVSQVFPFLYTWYSDCF